MALRIVSWNIRTLGDREGQEVDTVNAAAAIADVLWRIAFQSVPVDAHGTLGQQLDVLLVMEVSAGDAGADGLDAIARRLGWTYTPVGYTEPIGAWEVTGRTTASYDSTKADRYGVLWNPRTVALEGLTIDPTAAAGGAVPFVDRVPGIFRVQELATRRLIDLMLFHAPNPAPKGPAGPAYRSLALVTQLARVANHATDPVPLVICGDFNVDYNAYPAAYAVFPALGMTLQFTGAITSIYPRPAYLVSAYDNIITSPGVGVFDRRIVDFIDAFAGYERQRLGRALSGPEITALVRQNFARISDHLPVTAVVGL